MSWSLIANGGEGLGTNGGTTAGAGVLNTSGADFLVIGESYYTVGGPGTLTDSKSNDANYVKLTQQDSSSEVGCVIWYCKNAVVGSGHSFTISGSSTFCALHIAAFSGGHLTAPFDQQNGNGSFTPSTSANCGSVTPSEDNELLIWAGAGNSNTPNNWSIDIGTLLNQTISASLYTGALAYQIQTTATTRNATWTHSNYKWGACVATFKQATGGGVTAYSPFNAKNPRRPAPFRPMGDAFRPATYKNWR